MRQGNPGAIPSPIAPFVTGNWSSDRAAGDRSNIGAFAFNRANPACDWNLADGQRTVKRYFELSCLTPNPRGALRDSRRNIIGRGQRPRSAAMGGQAETRHYPSPAGGVGQSPEASRGRLDCSPMPIRQFHGETALSVGTGYGMQAHGLRHDGAAPYVRPTFLPHLEFCDRAEHCL